ncbi:MAG: hypothetical protein PVI62_19110, partial [Desulfobacterales bacterium]
GLLLVAANLYSCNSNVWPDAKSHGLIVISEQQSISDRNCFSEVYRMPLSVVLQQQEVAQPGSANTPPTIKLVPSSASKAVHNDF